MLSTLITKTVKLRFLSEKTKHFGFAQWTLRLRSVSKALTLCIMLLSPLLFLGEGLGVRCLAQVANGTGAGNALSYNGSNYVSMGNKASLHLSSAVTIEAWIKPNSFAEEGMIARNGLGFDLQYCFLVRTNGTISFHWYDGAFKDMLGVSVLQTGVWYHVAAVRKNDNTIEIYVNGNLDKTGSGTQTTASGGVFNIGSTQPGNNFQDFNGQIDEVRIWNTARTETEIRDNMCKKLTGSESGLVGYWRFDESSGGTAYDATTNGNNGTLY